MLLKAIKLMAERKIFILMEAFSTNKN